VLVRLVFVTEEEIETVVASEVGSVRRPLEFLEIDPAVAQLPQGIARRRAFTRACVAVRCRQHAGSD